MSLDAQREKLTAYAGAMDLILVDVFEDAGASAKNLEREGLRRALARLDQGDVGGLVITKLDRLTRNVRDLGDLVERYFTSTCALLSVSDSIDTRMAGGRLVLNVLTSVAQWEREAIGEPCRVEEVGEVSENDDPPARGRPQEGRDDLRKVRFCHVRTQR